MTDLILSADTTTCPACSSPIISTSLTHRQCNTCGLRAALVTTEQEHDIEDQRHLTSRSFAEEQDKTYNIARGQSQW